MEWIPEAPAVPQAQDPTFIDQKKWRLCLFLGSPKEIDDTSFHHSQKIGKAPEDAAYKPITYEFNEDLSEELGYELKDYHFSPILVLFFSRS